jgi:hypothetical protein
VFSSRVCILHFLCSVDTETTVSCAVAIGIVKGRELLLSPSLGSKEKFNAKTRIVLIMRNNGNSATIKGEEHSEEDVVKVKKVEVVDLDEKEGSFKVVMGSDI